MFAGALWGKKNNRACILAAILVLLLSINLNGCGSSSLYSDSQSNIQETPTNYTIEIGVSQTPKYSYCMGVKLLVFWA